MMTPLTCPCHSDVLINRMHAGKSPDNTLLSCSFSVTFGSCKKYIYISVMKTGSQMHHYSTRNSESYRTHPCKTNIKKFAILLQGPKIWNSLPTDIKAAPSFYSFKQLMKIFVRDKQNLSTHT